MTQTLSQIPIRNIYYLLCFAWRELETAGPLGLEPDDAENAPVQDLLARLLLASTRVVLRRGLIREYLPQEDILRMVRGKIRIPDTIRRTLLSAGLLACEYDEFLPDTLTNQIIKATLRLLSRAEGVNESHRHQLGGLAHRLGGVSDRRVRKSDFRVISVDRNGSHYRLLMAICELIWDLALPKEGDGQVRFMELLQHKNRMHKIFELFIFGFYKHHFGNSRNVYHSRSIDWWMEDETLEHSPLLPGMQADVIIEGSSDRIIFETKFYQEILVPGQHDEIERLRTGHLYQLHAYLSNLVAVPGPPIRGVLLYPVVNTPLHAFIPLQGHSITVHALNLDQPWGAIEEELIGLTQ